MIEKSSIFPSRETPVTYFAPIDVDRVTKIKMAIGQELGLDLSNLPILILDKNHPLFRFFEVRNKLYQKFKTDSEVMEVLNAEVPKFFRGDGSVIFRLRKLAQRKGLNLDDSFPGLVYTIAHDFIMYPEIREDKLIDMANVYAEKEQIEQRFKDIEQAKRFLSSLAEKYLAHEIGHVLYSKFADKIKTSWKNFIKDHPEIEQRVREVQGGNVSEGLSFELMAEEAFADTFGEMISYGHFVNRLGDFPEATALVRKIINEWQKNNNKK